MPSGRRHNVNGRGVRAAAGQFTSSNNLSNVNNNNNALSAYCQDEDERPLGNRTLAPKHVPTPPLRVDGQLTFEALSLIFGIIGACLQLLNLYRTVWWLPHSFNEYAMNFYIISPHLLVLIVTMTSRRLLYALLRRLIEKISPARWLPMAQRTMRIALLVLVIGILIWCLYSMGESFNSMKVFYLCYPSISVYFLMFGCTIRPFFDISTTPLYVKEDNKTNFLLDKPLHNCSLNASAIRAEVSSLKSDFNRRLKRALFASSGSAYVCTIAPVIFVPRHLHFNLNYVVLHIVLFWMGRLNAHFVQSYPVRYCDVLHRAALHLGKWKKIDTRSSLVPAQNWSETVLWPNGSLVKHNKDIYRSEGVCTAAEPGNSGHKRFYFLFGNPTLLLCSLLSLQLSLVMVQLFIIFQSYEWYQVISLTLLQLTNYYTLFKLVRDYLVCSKIYKAEQIMQEKSVLQAANSH